METPSARPKIALKVVMSDASRLYGELFEDAELAAIFSDQTTLQAMLDFEAALAMAEAKAGVIPQAAVAPIMAACHANLYDPAEIGRLATLAGNPAIPLVKLLTQAVAKADTDAAQWVHFGATSQDVIDTGISLQIGEAMAVMLRRHDDLNAALAALVRTHRHTVMPGRTFLQHAVPVTFGLKAAYWLDEFVSGLDRSSLAGKPWLQFGGAAGTLASLGGKAVAVAAMLRSTDLAFSPAKWSVTTFAMMDRPWHAGRRHRLRIACELGLQASALGKMARDIALMMQTEVGEVFEASAPGKGGSSTMPHKRNPVQCTAILANTARVPGLVATMLGVAAQEHERGLGGWHAEWPTLQALFLATGAALKHAVALVQGLEVQGARMRANVDITGGLLLAERVSMVLAAKLGKPGAHALIEEASRRALDERRHLHDVLGGMPDVIRHVSPTELEALFDPAGNPGATQWIIERILSGYEEDQHHRSGTDPWGAPDTGSGKES